MTIASEIRQRYLEEVVQDRWGGESVDDVYDQLQKEYPDHRRRQRLEQQFVQELDDYIRAAVGDLTEEQLLRFLNEPGVWRYVADFPLGAFTDDLSTRLEDWVRRYLEAEVDYSD